MGIERKPREGPRFVKFDWAIFANKCAIRHKLQGDFKKAKAAFEFAIGHLNLRNEIKTEKHLIVLNNQAELYRAWGKLPEANLIFKQVQELMEEIPHLKKADIAHNHHNYGQFLLDTCDYEKARELFEAAAEILRLEPRHDKEYALVLYNLARLESAEQNFDKAEIRAVNARSVLENLPSPHDLEIATALAVTNDLLAGLSEAVGDFGEAKKLALQTVRVFPAESRDTPIYASILNNTANLILSLDHRQDATKMLEEAIGILKSSNDPELAGSLEDRAIQYVIENEYAKALEFMDLAALLTDERIKKIFSITQETQRLSYMAALRKNYSLYLSLILQFCPNIEQHSQKALDFLLRRKGIIYESSAKQMPELYVGTPGAKSALEKLAAALPDETILIEFARVSPFDFHAVTTAGANRWQPDIYIASVLPAKNVKEVIVVDLGSAEIINDLIQTFREQFTSQVARRSSDSNNSEWQVLKGAETAGEKLYAKVLAPLVEHFSSSRQLIIAPDSALNLLPFDVLPTAEGRQVLDDYQITYVGTGRDVLQWEYTKKTSTTESLIVADPNFDLALDAAAGGMSFPDHPIRSKLPKFDDLPGTEPESKEISRILGAGCKILSRDQALKSSIEKIHSPKILHLATHGFVIENPQSGNLQRQLSQDHLTRRSLIPRIDAISPMQRSGLVLAGANTWQEGAYLPPEAKNGILMAEDVTALDLKGTELVVLSACQSGLGEIHTGEGVFGLRRAFALAGAMALVTSLWIVPDTQTKELMVDFYQRLMKGESIGGALRQAKLTMRKKYPQPYYWGAFICHGNSQPLSS